MKLPDIAENATYRYPVYLRWFTVGFNLLALVMPLWFASGLLLKLVGEDQSSWLSGLVSIIIPSLWFAGVAILTANFFPEVIATERGLLVGFLWLRLPVTWGDIKDVRPAWINLPGRPTTWVVRTQALTPFHRLYGLLYGLTWLPSFIIRYEIANRDDLISKVKRRSYR